MKNYSLNKWFSTLLQNKMGYILFLYLLTILLIGSSKLISPNFGTWNQVESILVISSLMVVIGFGQGLVILLGELDLSVGSTLSLTGVLTTSWLGINPSLTNFVYIILILSIIGLVNGIGITLLKVPSFIMTLATQMIIVGIALGITKGTVPGKSPLILQQLMTGKMIDIPIPVFIILAMMVIGTYIQMRSTLGRKLYSIGSNRVASHLAGLPVNLIIITAFVISSICAGLTGMMIVGYAGGATLSMGQPYLLPSIAIVVIGGSSILGGSGNYLGTVAAAIFLTTITTIIQALGVSQGWQTVLYGLMILLVLSIFRKELYILLNKFKTGVSTLNKIPNKQNTTEKIINPKEEF